MLPSQRCARSFSAWTLRASAWRRGGEGVRSHINCGWRWLIGMSALAGCLAAGRRRARSAGRSGRARLSRRSAKLSRKNARRCVRLAASAVAHLLSWASHCTRLRAPRASARVPPPYSSSSRSRLHCLYCCRGPSHGTGARAVACVARTLGRAVVALACITPE